MTAQEWITTHGGKWEPTVEVEAFYDCPYPECPVSELERIEIEKNMEEMRKLLRRHR
jgi:hypothetical protein